MTRLTLLRPIASPVPLAPAVGQSLRAAARYARRGGRPTRVVAPNSPALFAEVREIAQSIGVHPEAELEGDAVTITFTALPAVGLDAADG